RADLERKALGEKRDEVKKLVEDEVDPAKALIEEQQKAQKDLQDPSFSEEKKKEIFAEAQKRAVQITEIQRKALGVQQQGNTSLVQSANEANVTLLKEIQDGIAKVAEEKGLHLVHNTSFGVSGIPTVPFAKGGGMVDITDDVIGFLNKNAPASWGKTE
ncbi:MAG: OmpH family outer membrane protein, partial [Verrucomicrobiota bacterium]